MKRAFVIAALIFAFIAPGVMNSACLGQTGNVSASETSAKSAHVDALFTKFDRDKSPGVAVLVVRNGEVIHHKGYGLARLEPAEVIGANTPFDLASTSKQFTAMAVMILAERGKLSYDDPLAKYFPELPAYAGKITIRHLLTHTSGLTDVINASWFKEGYSPSPKEVAAFLTKEANTKSAPGQKFEYNNTGYLLLALIVEKASGMRFAKFMRENVFTPLGMNHSLVWDETKPKIDNLAISYAPAGNSFTPIKPVSDSFVFGAKGVISTTSDLIKWVQHLEAPKLVKPETLQLAFRPMKLNDGSESAYGFGFGMATEGGLATIEHPGGYLGYRTNLKHYPSERLTIVVLSNNAQLDGLALGRSIGRIYLGDKMATPQPTLKVEPAVLAGYVGKYESQTAGTEGLVLEITLENGELFITSPIRPKTNLVAKSDIEFSIGGGTATVTFKKDDKAVTGLSLKSRMGIIEARRLN